MPTWHPPGAEVQGHGAGAGLRECQGAWPAVAGCQSGNPTWLPPGTEIDELTKKTKCVGKLNFRKKLKNKC